MLRFALGLLYFFLQISLFFVKSYVGWEICALASHLHVLCFQSEGGIKSLRTAGGEIKNFMTWWVTDLGGYFSPKTITFKDFQALILGHDFVDATKVIAWYLSLYGGLTFSGFDRIQNRPFPLITVRNSQALSLFQGSQKKFPENT